MRFRTNRFTFKKFHIRLHCYTPISAIFLENLTPSSGYPWITVNPKWDLRFEFECNYRIVALARFGMTSTGKNWNPLLLSGLSESESKTQSSIRVCRGKLPQFICFDCLLYHSCRFHVCSVDNSKWNVSHKKVIDAHTLIGNSAVPDSEIGHNIRFKETSTTWGCANKCVWGIKKASKLRFSKCGGCCCPSLFRRIFLTTMCKSQVLDTGRKVDIKDFCIQPAWNIHNCPETIAQGD